MMRGLPPPGISNPSYFLCWLSSPPTYIPWVWREGAPSKTSKKAGTEQVPVPLAGDSGLCGGLSCLWVRGDSRSFLELIPTLIM